MNKKVEKGPFWIKGCGCPVDTFDEVKSTDRADRRDLSQGTCDWGIENIDQINSILLLIILLSKAPLVRGAVTEGDRGVVFVSKHCNYDVFFLSLRQKSEIFATSLIRWRLAAMVLPAKSPLSS